MKVIAFVYGNIDNAPVFGLDFGFMFISFVSFDGLLGIEVHNGVWVGIGWLFSGVVRRWRDFWENRIRIYIYSITSVP